MKKNGKDAKEAHTTQGVGTALPSQLPLFFERPAPLELPRHEKAGVIPSQNFAFASASNSIPLNLIEFAEASRHYPIVFTQSDPTMPVAIVGLEQKNYFVDANGKWKEPAYIPAYVRKHPFIFMEVPARKQFVLCVDEAAPQFRMQGDGDSKPLYADGKPSDATKHALEFCTAFHNHFQFTRQLCAELKKEELLVPNGSEVKLFNGRIIRLGGFQIIDEKKFNALPDKKFLEYRRKGWLPFIYFAIASAPNWQRLVNIAADFEREQAA